MDTLANLQRKLAGAEDLKSVVRTMKAMAASNIGQYEVAVDSLEHYHRTIALGIVAYFQNRSKDNKQRFDNEEKTQHKSTCAIVFGSDQGLVGQFNNTLADFVTAHLNDLSGEKIIWAVGDRVQLLLKDQGFESRNVLVVPNTVHAITPLVSQLLLKSEEAIANKSVDHFYIFHNQPKVGAGYIPVVQQLLPLDSKWKESLLKLEWPTALTPQIVGNEKATLKALIHEYLFTSLFKASAESLASENASRLIAMQRAEKNIGELLEELKHTFHSLRQSLIDEELFDVVSGFEALKKN